jgi:ADP-heptose:LPS heptosyltransferase
LELMFEHLQIYDRRDRALVGTADLALRIAAPALRLGRRSANHPLRRILLLRLERIGDLLMSLDGIADVRHAAPDAEIDLVVGSWNAELARRIPGLQRVDTLDVPWLARDGTGLTRGAMLRQARSWAGRRYDLAINFEPDIRSNVLLALSRASTTAGFRSAGGGPLLDVALTYDPTSHSSDNVRRLAAAVLDVSPRTMPARLEIAAPERQRAGERIGAVSGPAIGMHVSGGRAIKQWDVGRFAELAHRLSATYGATILLTGSDGDRPLIDRVRGAAPQARIVDLAGSLDLPSLAAVLERLDLFVTGDTGPMHLAAAVGTPVVAIFGPSDPARYAPRDPMHHVVRVDLPCSPCNRIRLPPARCVGHTPDCLTGVDVEMVFQAAARALAETASSRPRSTAARG